MYRINSNGSAKHFNLGMVALTGTGARHHHRLRHRRWWLHLRRRLTAATTLPPVGDRQFLGGAQERSEA